MQRFACFDAWESGVIYRSISGLQGYYPRVVRLDDEEFLTSFVAGTALETPDSHPMLTRSIDGGVSWTLQGPVDTNRSEEFPPTETGFISLDSDGTLICLGVCWLIDPENPDLPLVNPKTVGMRDNQMVFRRSSDGGRSWSAARILPKPFPSPLELPTGMISLNDGTNMLSCSTWRKWDGTHPFGHRVFVIESSDRCNTWSAPIDIFYDPTHRIGYWEGRITPMAGDDMLATCWAHEWSSDEDLPNQFALSQDGGKSWTSPLATHVMGQTGWPLWLGGNQILFVYNHRRKPVGVRAQIAESNGESWITVFDDEAWSPAVKTENAITTNDYAVTGFQFGAPSAIRLDERNVMVVYWCVENGHAGINWTMITLHPQSV